MSQLLPDLEFDKDHVGKIDQGFNRTTFYGPKSVNDIDLNFKKFLLFLMMDFDVKVYLKAHVFLFKSQLS